MLCISPAVLLLSASLRRTLHLPVLYSAFVDVFLNFANSWRVSNPPGVMIPADTSKYVEDILTPKKLYVYRKTQQRTYDPAGVERINKPEAINI